MTRVANPRDSGPHSVLSLDAEQTIRLLMLTAAQHARQEAVLAVAPRPRGRLRTLPTSSASHQARTQSTLLRLVSIVEAHVVSQLVQRIEPHVPKPRTKFLNDIYLSAEDRAIGSWPGLIEAYKQWLDVKLASCDDWQCILAMTDARNAVAHGVGELSRRQARKDIRQLTALFSVIDVKINGMRLEVSDSAIRSVAAAARRFVMWLDMQLLDHN